MFGWLFISSIILSLVFEVILAVSPIAKNTNNIFHHNAISNDNFTKINNNAEYIAGFGVKEEEGLRKKEAHWEEVTASENASFRFLPRVSTNVAAVSPIPLPVRGKCTAGQSFVIKSIRDLQKNIADLECIFAAGISPASGEVPLGFNYGYLLAAANTAFWNNLINLGYQGDYVVRTQCEKKYYNIGWLSAGGLKIGTALWYIGTFPYAQNLGNGEYPLGDQLNIVMDFTVDFKQLCPIEGNESPHLSKGFSPFRNSLYPINNFVDIGRIVGRDESDGGLIILNKAFIVLGNEARTSFIYATKNFDPKVTPYFAKKGPQCIFVPKGPNGETEIFYHRVAIEGIAEELFQAGINNLPSSPFV